ncbi:MAG: hypothetical protein WBQ94_04405 [Terracidiphilus sp.]
MKCGAPDYFDTAIHDSGMVEVEGEPGLFAPSLLVIDGEVTAVPVMGKVD